MTSFILVVLGGIGLIVVFVGLRWLVVAISRHPHLQRIKGTVLSVEKKDDYGGDEKQVTFYPVIAYTTPHGQQVKFRSKTGISRPSRPFARNPQSPWRDGQSIDVFHDPSGELEPCIASLWHLYFGPIGFLIGGILLLIIVANRWNQVGGQ